MTSAEPVQSVETPQPQLIKNLQVGDLAFVIEGSGGANRVRKAPWVDASIIDQIPESAVLALLPKPDAWNGDYPYADGQRVWWYVRGRTAGRHADGRFKVVEG